MRFANLRHDFPAAIVIFLVALPLCLGIAMASEAPLFSGIITGVIAGMVVGLLSGSQLSVSGPAAGLTVIIAGGIKTLGSFEIFLAAVTLSGLFQILFGIARAGFLAALLPNSVVRGMLAAIGATIILKQLPHVMGGLGHFESDMAIWHLFGKENTFEYLWEQVHHYHFSALFISLSSLALLNFWESSIISRNRWLSHLPGPLVAVSVAAGFNQIFHANFPSLALRAEGGHLVQLPEINSLASLIDQLRFPDFSLLGSSQELWIVALTIAAVGSIESLLCLESVDKLDPLKRLSNGNRELIAQGTGNLICGLIGGLPMTSVIVRSSANIYAGARTRLSSILHGAILMVSALALSSILNLIPLAALAAVLVVVGYKLAHPKLIGGMLRAGWDQFIPFIVTFTAILFMDLLWGVAIGWVAGLFCMIRASYQSSIQVVRQDNLVLIRLTKDVTFIHKIHLRKELAQVNPGDRVLFDGSRNTFIDHDVYEMIQDYSESAKARGIEVSVKDLELVPRPVEVFRRLPKDNNGIIQKTTSR